jgi:PHD/YefM family antitoxin component YafN of YafNO toxin-antitoxin module
MSVNEYVTMFTQLSHGAPYKVDTDEKKQDYFLNDLNDGLAYALEAQDFENFQGMVNKALVPENRRGVMEHKHKLVHQHQPDSNSRPCVATPSTEPIFHPTQPHFQSRPQSAGQGFFTAQRQVIQRPNNFQTPAAGSQNVQRTQATQYLPQDDRRCFNYGEKGHYANRGPNLHTRANQPTTGIPSPTHGTNSISVAAK